MNAARGGQATHPTPTRASTSAAQNLSPAYPRRAAWGTAGSLRAWQAAALGQYLETMPQDFLAVATRSAKVVFPAPGVATARKSWGIASRYCPRAAACQARSDPAVPQAARRG